MSFKVRRLTQDAASSIFNALKSRYGEAFPNDVTIDTILKRIDSSLKMRGFNWVIIENNQNTCVGVASYESRQKNCFNIRYSSLSKNNCVTIPLSKAIDKYIRSISVNNCFIGYVILGGLSDGWF